MTLRSSWTCQARPGLATGLRCKICSGTSESLTLAPLGRSVVTHWLPKQLHLRSLCGGFLHGRCQADDTTSALHTSLLNEASYAEHLEPAGGLPWDAPDAPTCEINGVKGGAEAESVAVQTADDELAAAAAALVEALAWGHWRFFALVWAKRCSFCMWQASGLVVRVAGRAFVRMLEEAEMCNPNSHRPWIGAESVAFSRPGILFLAVCLPHSAVPWEFQAGWMQRVFIQEWMPPHHVLVVAVSGVLSGWTTLYTARKQGDVKVGKCKQQDVTVVDRQWPIRHRLSSRVSVHDEWLISISARERHLR